MRFFFYNCLFIVPGFSPKSRLTSCKFNQKLLFIKGKRVRLVSLSKIHSKVYSHFYSKVFNNSFVLMKSVFDKNFKIVLPWYLLKKFRIFRKYHELVWSSFFNLFYHCDWFLFEKMVRKLFNDTRLDRHGRLFKFIYFFFKKYPYYSPNIYYVCLKVKGKMSRKGTARKKTIYSKRYFFENEGIKPIFSLSKYYFLIISKTGCTCFLGFIRQNH